MSLSAPQDDAATTAAGPTRPAVAATAADSTDPRLERLFRSLDVDNDGQVQVRDVVCALTRVGLRPGDERLRQSMTALGVVGGEGPADLSRPLDMAGFCRAIQPNVLLLERALQGRMVIPDFESFRGEIDAIFTRVQANTGGRPASYIPQLAVTGASADRFGLALCTVDGQRHARGHSDHFFTVQSTTKVVSYALALEEHGAEAVHRHIGHEPSGAGFNELTLDKERRPHNPMINAGAIMSSALIGLSEKRALLGAGDATRADLRGWAGRRFEHVIDRWRALCGNAAPRFSAAVFLSERETADRNRALAYYMRENDAFPCGADLDDVLEFYLQCCAIEVDAEMLSAVAATLANGGICPVTGERVLGTGTVRNCLSLMSGCGMYDFAGEFAYAVGLPAKSGVSGAVMVVVPNVMGFCVWSPRLDEIGNSVRGIAFCRELVARFNLHNYDNLTGGGGKRDPRLNPIQQRARQVNEVIWAASKGDVGAIQELMQRGDDAGYADYDGRTALHLAAAENRRHVVRFFTAEAGLDLNPRDRWGGTPLDDAYLHGHDEIVALLEQAGAVRGQARSRATDRGADMAPGAEVDTLKADEVVWAASLGDLAALRCLVAQGASLGQGDYDCRTALHLAAAEGHVDAVRYCIAHGVPVNPRDRWGNTPLDDALRHGQDDIAAVLREHGGESS